MDTEDHKGPTGQIEKPLTSHPNNLANKLQINIPSTPICFRKPIPRSFKM